MSPALRISLCRFMCFTLPKFVSICVRCFFHILQGSAYVGAQCYYAIRYFAKCKSASTSHFLQVLPGLHRFINANHEEVFRTEKLSTFITQLRGALPAFVQCVVFGFDELTSEQLHSTVGTVIRRIIISRNVRFSCIFSGTNSKTTNFFSMGRDTRIDPEKPWCLVNTLFDGVTPPLAQKLLPVFIQDQHKQLLAQTALRNLPAKAFPIRPLFFVEFIKAAATTSIPAQYWAQYGSAIACLKTEMSFTASAAFIGCRAVLGDEANDWVAHHYARMRAQSPYRTDHDQVS